MKKENISLTQLAAVVFNFQIGSNVAIGLGLNAKEDAWIALLISLLIGIGITYFFIYMTTLAPGKNLFEMFEYCFNRPIAITLSMVYAIYFFYYACRIIRDFGELIASTVLPLTPIEVSTVMLVLLMGYILYMGLEVLARTAEIFTPYGIVLNVLLFLFLYVGKSLDYSSLKPILGEGLKPIWEVIFPYEIVRPYGQLIVLTYILSSVSNVKYSKKLIILSVLASGLLLFLTSIMIILALGNEIALRSTFPLLSAARLVSIGDFIQRIDAIVVFCMMLGTLVKSCIYMYGGLKALEYTFKLSFRYFSIPMTCIVAMFSVFISRNFTEHLNEGLISNPFLLHIPLQFGIPVAMVCVMLLKLAMKQKKNGTVGSDLEQEG
ncbi:GerAB/ArcD/ProY family transporter [Bacillus sp. B1-b2]|uniref:GerAB/ArcD/ProY family transporter n=1 Tax=Bacillus sp. B1-b2 TaxID=2653201 RepID=UPI0012621C28|nr:endospore germination permease [Bacillus sp. B1-b2]KAB7672497.1 GerAB/ArcD/ProY family transporter [Bacillus sp. B1-b2]